MKYPKIPQMQSFILKYLRIPQMQWTSITYIRNGVLTILCPHEYYYMQNGIRRETTANFQDVSSVRMSGIPGGTYKGGEYLN